MLATLASLLVGCAQLDGSHLPDSERLTVDGPVLSAPPPPVKGATSPAELDPPVPAVACVAAWLGEPTAIPAICPRKRPFSLDDVDVKRVAAPEFLVELRAALAQQPPAATARAFTLLTRVHLYERDHFGSLASAQALLEALEPDPPRWRAAIEALSEDASCDLASELIAAGGKMWTGRPELRPGVIYLVAAVFERCHDAVGTHLSGTTPELLQRFGAPFPAPLLGAMLDEFPTAFAHITVLWPEFRDAGGQRRAEAVDAGLVAFVERARGVAFCGLGSLRVGPLDRCWQALVRRALSDYIGVLESAHDVAALRVVRTTLRELARDPELDVVVGDIVDSIDARRTDPSRRAS